MKETLKSHLRKIRLENLERMRFLKEEEFKTEKEWEEYHMLQHKYEKRGRRK